MSDKEYTDETFIWFLTAVAVAIIVILTLLVVICLLKSSPERELEVIGGAGGSKLRAVAYFNKYWKVTDDDAPKFDSTRREIKKYSFGTLWTKAEIEKAEEDELKMYSLKEQNTTVASAT